MVLGKESPTQRSEVMHRDSNVFLKVAISTFEKYFTRRINLHMRIVKCGLTAIFLAAEKGYGDICWLLFEAWGGSRRNWLGKLFIAAFFHPPNRWMNRPYLECVTIYCCFVCFIGWPLVIIYQCCHHSYYCSFAFSLRDILPLIDQGRRNWP